jgi:23S rRNA (cytosine1962-C5)-methyltransferase
MRALRIGIDEEAAQAVRRGRPWVYREAVHGKPSGAAGAAVDLVDRQGAFVGRGLFEPGAAIAVRVLTRNPEELIGEDLLARRLAEALALRRRLLPAGEVTAYRLCNGEGDQLSGLVVDLYEQFAVLQLGTPAWAPHREAIGAALRRVLPELAGAVEKSRLTPGRGGEIIAPLFGAEPPEELIVREGPARFAVQLRGTNKSGLFLDQRETREALRRISRGAAVLNAFAFTGSLSVAAALGGATRVTSLDLSGASLSRARRNFEVNGIDPDAHEWVAGDAFEEMPAMQRSGRRFDVVVVDPPAFATAKKRVFQAERDWRDLSALALGLLHKGGVLVACSPMAALAAASFERALAEGAARARTSLRVFDVRSQPADHPVDAACPERRYLKVFFAARG